MTCRGSLRSTRTELVVQPVQDVRDGTLFRIFSNNTLTWQSAITLVGEADRKMLKAAIKQSDASKVRHRVIPADAISSMADKLEALKDDVQEVLKEEREEKLMRQADMEIRKGQNMVEHEKEIFGRPARTWFQSEKEKKKAQGAFDTLKSAVHC
jgi:hypothetical protein